MLMVSDVCVAADSREEEKVLRSEEIPEEGLGVEVVLSWCGREVCSGRVCVVLFRGCAGSLLVFCIAPLTNWRANANVVVLLESPLVRNSGCNNVPRMLNDC